MLYCFGLLRKQILLKENKFKSGGLFSQFQSKSRSIVKERWCKINKNFIEAGFKSKRLCWSIILIRESKNLMNFGPSFIFPPPHPYYYCLYPPQPFYYPAPTISYPQFPSQMNALSGNSKNEVEQRLIQVTEEDLVEEGYEQSKKAWTEEEDLLLMRLCSKPNAFFDEVAQHLPGRNSKMCYSRYRRLTNSSKKYWTKS